VTSVGATSVVVTTAATADGTSSDATGTITVLNSPCLLLDKASAHCAFQKLPNMERASVPNRIGSNLKMWSLLGRYIRLGTHRVVHI
jgi:hypothetical protein